MEGATPERALAMLEALSPSEHDLVRDHILKGVSALDLAKSRKSSRRMVIQRIERTMDLLILALAEKSLDRTMLRDFLRIAWLRRAADESSS